MSAWPLRRTLSSSNWSIMSFPLFRRELGADLTYAALKGFSHYPCLHKVERLVVEGPGMRTVGKEQKPQAPALAALLSFIEQTAYDIGSLNRLPHAAALDDHHHEPRLPAPQMSVFGTSCFVHGSRRKAEAANIVVTNHSLLFCDLAADGGLLPPIRYWVVDEAHSAESEARRAFSLELAEEGHSLPRAPRSFRGISAQRLRTGGAHRCHAGQ